MAINERSRHELFARLEEMLGKEHATVLMEHLPPVGWADVATKHDLDQLESRLEIRFDALKFELLATFRAELNSQTRTMISQTRTMIFAMATTSVAVAGVALAAARLA